MQTPPQNLQFPHIGCIYVLTDAPSGRPDPIRISTNIPYPTETATWIKVVGTPQETQECHPIQSSVIH